jgi:1-deoxy-D-xylulose-5-phosphate synthase
VFGQWLTDMAARDERIVGITPGDARGLGLVEYSKKFPQRYFDVPLPSSTRVTFAAGLACDGDSSPWWLSTPPSCSAPTIS